MTTFATPGPVTVDIDVMCAEITVTAEERADTVVTVTPVDPDNKADVDAAEKTRVELTNGVVVVKCPKLRGYVDWTYKKGLIELSIALPSGSTVSGSAWMANLTATGHLASCEFKSGMGNLFVDRVDAVKLKASGDITVEEVDGDADLTTGMGRLRLGRATGTVRAKNSNGPCSIGRVDGALTLRASNGDVEVDRAGGDVDAVSSHGNVRVGEVRGGTVELKSSMGQVEVGVAEGTAAWLDAHTGFGSVRNEMTGTGEPAPGDPVVRIHARSSYGDITVRRSAR